MSEAKESTVTVAGCKIYMLRGGKGEPLLFLHGGGGVGVWLPFFEKLSDHYDVIMPEHPGFGRSDTPDWLDRVSDLANFYLEFIQQFGLKDIHLVGHSLGGWTAADLAVRNTAPLRTLTLLAPAGISVPDVPPGDIFMWSPEQLTRNLVRDQKIADMILGMPMDDEERQRQNKNSLTLAKLTWQPRLHDPDLRKWLHRIDRPALVVWGDSDKIMPPPYGPAYRDLIPGAKLHVLKECGHLPQVEKPDELLATLTSFIAEAKR